MMVRKIVAGSVLGVGMTAMALGGAGSAFAGTGEPGKPGQGGGNVSVTHTTTVNKTTTNIANGNKFLNGNLNGNKIASGNSVVIKVSILDGALSNNVFNSGASSFNTTQVKGNGNFNTVTVDVNKTITTNNSYGKPGTQGPGH